MTRRLIVPLLALLAFGCKEKAPAHRMGTSVNIAPTGVFQVIPATMDPNASNLPGAVGTRVQNAGGGNAWDKGSDGLWHAITGSSGGGGISPDGGVAFPLTGMGTAASPLSIATTWRQAMFALCKARHPTVTEDFVVDYTLGASATGDYGAFTENNTVTNYSSVVNMGGVVLDTSTATIANSRAYVNPRNNPTIVGNVATGAPWCCYGRAQFASAPVATGQNFPITLTQVSPFTFGAPALGMIGSNSTTNLTFTDGASNISTSQAQDITSTFHDYFIDDDGVTLTALYGNIMTTGITQIASSTNRTGLHSGPGQPAAFLSLGGTSTARQTMTTAEIGCAVASP